MFAWDGGKTGSKTNITLVVKEIHCSVPGLKIGVSSEVRGTLV